MLVEEPGHLSGMTYEIARKFRGNHEVNRDAVALRDVQKPPGQTLAHDLGGGVPLERHVDHVHAKAAAIEVLFEFRYQDLRSPHHERSLYRANGHRPHTRGPRLTS